MLSFLDFQYLYQIDSPFWKIAILIEIFFFSFFSILGYSGASRCRYGTRKVSSFSCHIKELGIFWVCYLSLMRKHIPKHLQSRVGCLFCDPVSVSVTNVCFGWKHPSLLWLCTKRGSLLCTANWVRRPQTGCICDQQHQL